MKTLLTTATILLLCTCSFAQNLWNSNQIPTDLKKGANAIIRNYQKTITLKKQDLLTEEVYKVTTILDEDGLGHLQQIVSYKGSTEKVNIKDFIVYDSNGIKLKKIKRKDIKDLPSYDGISMISDQRQKIVTFEPIAYPITVELRYTISRENTLHLGIFYPVSYYKTSVENSSYEIINETEIPIKSKAYRLEDFNITRHSNLHYTAKNIRAIRSEKNSQQFGELFPKVVFRSEAFNYEGHKGSFTSWDDYGEWINTAFLQKENNLKKQDIPSELAEIYLDNLTEKEKVELVYNYIQENTRYILINLEDGGLKPMKSGDVNKLKYGDCKALSFYMYSILKSANLPIKYGVVYAGTTHKLSMDESFPNPYEANHIIVNIPLEEEDIWLDCTSTYNPFNFLGSFTDDRKVLLVDENEVIIKSTPNYGKHFNKTVTQSYVNLEDNSVRIQKDNFGIKMSSARGLSRAEKEYRNEYISQSYFPILKTTTLKHYDTNENNKDFVFSENFEFECEYLKENIGEYIQLNTEVYNFDIPALNKTKNRRFPVTFIRTSIDQETIEYELDGSYKLIDSVEEIKLDSKYATYNQSISLRDQKLIISRSLEINKGTFPSNEYKEIRSFFNNVESTISKKITLKKI